MTVTLHPARKASRVLTLLSLTGLCAAALPAQAALTTLASFTGANGDRPQSGVTFDSSGNLFGTTKQGGSSNNGTVYEIANGSNTITTLASFTGTAAGTNGANPYAGVTFDSSGNLFGTTTSGGDSGNGTVYEIAQGTNNFSTVASFTSIDTHNANANGASPYGGVSFDSSGNLFGTTTYGGTSGFGTVYEIAKGGTTITALASFTGVGTNGEYPNAGVTLDSSGNLFGTTENGGNNSSGTVYEIAQGSKTITDLAALDGIGFGTNGVNPIAGVTIDSNGNLFGTTQSDGASGFGTVYEIAQGTNKFSTLASFTGIGNNGASPYGGVTFDSSGNLFGTTETGGTSNRGTVYEIVQGTSTITTLASFTGTGTNGRSPYAGVTLDSSGNLFGTTYQGGASGNGTVYEIAGAGSPSAAPEPSQFAALGLTTLGVGGLLLRARKRRQTVPPGA